MRDEWQTGVVIVADIVFNSCSRNPVVIGVCLEQAPAPRVHIVYSIAMAKLFFNQKKNYFFKIRPALRWLITLHGSTRAIAGGFALGTFIAFTPTVGVQMILGAVLATFFNLNRPAAIVSAWISNPFTIPPLFTFNYWVGSLLLGGPSVTSVYSQLIDICKQLATLNMFQISEQFMAFVAMGKDVFIPLVLGSVVVGAVCAVIIYWLSLRILFFLNRKRRAKAVLLP